MELFEKYYTHALKFLSYRPRSEKELRDSLIKRKAPDEIIQTIFKLLKEQKFLSDEDFTKWWIEQRSSFKPRSKRVISMELKQKGISQELITKYLVENEESSVNDLEQALRLIQKKSKRYEHLDREELYQKLGGALARKGFSWDVIKRAIDLSLKKEWEFMVIDFFWEERLERISSPKYRTMRNCTQNYAERIITAFFV